MARMRPAHDPADPPSAAGPLYAGIDVGGTNIKIGLVDDHGATAAYRSIPTNEERGPEDAAGRIAETVRALAAEAGVASDAVVRAGLATPGPMDIPRGMLLIPGNLPHWHNSRIRELVSVACDLPVTFANDANAAAFGEFWHGAARDYRSLVLFTMGTGIGGGIVVDDMLIEGVHSAGGELGHIIIDARDDAPENSLGLRGTLEGFCGAYAVVRRTAAALATQKNSSLHGRLAAGAELTPLLVAQEAEGGDELAREVVMETARYMAIGIATVVHTVDPESVVIGGAMTFGGDGHPLGEQFMACVRRHARARMLAPIRDKVHIDFAVLGGDAGYIGAAGLARREHHGAVLMR
ncbi:MAG TPA: ROK family protein [Lacipirellulaceae bacterium]|nr:ROK family protein [Lacipirellulaceae bacterium]